jgi:hypothetical protein
MKMKRPGAAAAVVFAMSLMATAVTAAEADADKPQQKFKGNGVAVPTAPFWDDELAALQARAQKKENLKPEEEKRLKAGVSNGGYHYLGAAKIMAPIGKAFAESMANLQTPQRQEKQ